MVAALAVYAAPVAPLPDPPTIRDPVAFGVMEMVLIVPSAVPVFQFWLAAGATR